MILLHTYFVGTLVVTWTVWVGRESMEVMAPKEGVSLATTDKVSPPASVLPLMICLKDEIEQVNVRIEKRGNFEIVSRGNTAHH